MTDQSWTIETEDVLLDVKPYLRVTRQHVVTDQGTHVEDYYQVEFPDFVIMCALTPDQQIITLWQYKHGARCYGLTFPAGLIEPGEPAEDAVRRELLEETGYRAGAVRFLGRCAVSGNQGCGFAHLYVVTDCIRIAEPCSGDLETMDLKLMSTDAVDTAIRDGAVSVLPHLALWGGVKAHGLVV